MTTGQRQLLFLPFLAGCEPVVPPALEIGAEDPVWDPASLPIFRLTLPADWEAQLTALIPTDSCAERGTIFGSLDYENPQSGETETYPDVAVRYRGHSALDDPAKRLGLKLLFDAVDPDVRFHDMQNVNLLGSEGDDSLLRERAAQLLMDRLGVPAPRVNHGRVYVNDAFIGLFPIAEEPDDQAFLDAHFGDPSGHLYKVEGYCGGQADFAYKSDDVADYDTMYEAKAGTSSEDVLDDLLPMIKCAAGLSGDLATCLPESVDVEQWLAEMAVDAAMPDVDGLAGAGQNFMIYADPSSQRMVVYPWDKDQAFRTTDLASSSIFDFHPPWGTPPPVTLSMRQLWSAEYCDLVDRAADEALDLDETVGALAAFLEPYAAEDAYLIEHDWAAQVADLRATLADRAAEAKAEVDVCNASG